MYDPHMSATYTRDAPERTPNGPRAVDDRYLHRIISTVSSTLDLDRVLSAIVDLVSEAIDCHATFIYFVGDDGSLTLRAVSDPYRALVDRLRFEPGEGLAGWVAQHDEPVFLADNALDDPRIKVVPEADEEQYQSFLAVPLRGKGGGVLGVIALHAEAPREFNQADMDFLTHSASLVAGAIENARLYQDTRRRLALVEDMADLARTIAAAATLESLLPEVARRAQALLDAEACQVLLVGADGATLRPAGQSPAGSATAPQMTASGLAVELAQQNGERSNGRLAAMVWPDHADSVPLVAPLVSGEELLGFLALRLGRSQATTPEKREVVALIAGQTAVAVQKAQLIDRLTERNAIKDFLEDLSRGAMGSDILGRARALGCDLHQPHLVLQAAPRGEPGPEWDDVCASLESSLARLFPGSMCDRREATVRGLVRLKATREQEAVDALRTLH
jgi:GAF domain-containing protein